MKRLGWLTLAVILCAGFVPIRDAQSPGNALHVLSTVGRKAWIAFNDTESTKYTRITKFGFNKDVDTAASESLVSFGGDPRAQMGLSAETLSIVSTDVDDTSAGTGARTISVTCIDGDGLQTTILVTLNGLTPVVTTQTCKFVNRANVLTGGTSRANEGAINITQSSSGVQLAQIPATRSSTQQLIYYVPSDRRCYIENIYIRARKTAGGVSPKVEFNILVYSQTQDIIYDVREYFVDTAVSTFIQQIDFKAEQVRPNQIVAIELLTNANNTIVTGSMDITCKVD